MNALDPSDAKTFLDWSYAQPKLKQLRDAWEAGEKEQTRINRDLRSVRVSVDDMRNRGELEQDETFIPLRIIDANITKEAAPFIQYLSQSDRLVIMTSQQGIPEADLRFREKEFTRVMRYRGWLNTFIKVKDGADTHGWDNVEVVFDETKPGHVGIEHVGHDGLMIPRDTRNLQDCEFVGRIYRVGIYTLKKLAADPDFSREQLEKVVEAVKSAEGNSNLNITLYEIVKVMFKVDGIVYVAWWSKDASEWLKKPAPLFLGRKQAVMVSTGADEFGNPLPPEMSYNSPESQMPEREYPFYQLYYRETEMPEIFQHAGRVFLDEPKQDAASTLMTSFVNATTRASNFVATPSQNTNGATKLQILDNVEIKNGCVYNMPLTFTSLPYPDVAMLRGIQTIQTQNADETSSTAFAVNNRKDSRKSATEISAAQEQQSTLQSVTLVMQSAFVCDVFTRCEQIVNSRALAGLIEYAKRDGKTDEATLRVAIQIQPAGDVDVIERQKTLQALTQGYSMIATNPVAMQSGLMKEVLKDLMRLALPPGMGDRYAMILEQGDPARQLLAQLTQAVEKLVVDPRTGSLQPYAQPFAPVLAQLNQQVNAVLGAGGPPQ